MMKVYPIDLMELLALAESKGFARGAGDTDSRVKESVKALLAENSRLKMELDGCDSRVMVAEQKASFFDVNAERVRIVKALRRYMGKKKMTLTANDILFAVALGDVK